MLIDNGNLPAVAPADDKPEEGTLQADVANEWKGSHRIGLVPYLDYATPTFYDTLSAAVQQLTAGKLDAAGVHGAAAEGLRRLPEDSSRDP